jgi:ferric-dicitrate binding protein FerR (iron transport regulator)
MRIAFPSHEFDEAVAAVCHGSASDEQMRALNELLQTDSAARDEYILRVEVHSRLVSEPDLFASAGEDASSPAFPNVTRIPRQQSRRHQKLVWMISLAACFALMTAGLWIFRPARPVERTPTSNAVALLNKAVDAQWNKAGQIPQSGAPLEPGLLQLESGLAQLVFYSGARVVVEGPAEVQIVTQDRVICRRGRLTADVPAQARGFRVETPHSTVTDLGASFALDVKERLTELHVFKGAVKLQSGRNATEHHFGEGAGAVVESSNALRPIKANPAAFASLFDLQEKSLATQALRYNRWRVASERLNRDPSLLVRFDFEDAKPTRWQLENVCNRKRSEAMNSATIVGCQWVQGRWPGKRAIEFQGVSDRVRLNVPGHFEALTLAAWIRVQGLDRKLNSLFVSDGFDAGTVHWLVRHDGVLGLTIVGEGSGNYQIVTSPSVLTLDKFGMWLHLAVVLDGRSGRVVHYVNGLPVSEKALRIKPPYRIGTGELGNWNARGFPGNDPFMIRNFSGAMDEFCLFSRALNAGEVRDLYSEGKPEPDAFSLQ